MNAIAVAGAVAVVVLVLVVLYGAAKARGARSNAIGKQQEAGLEAHERMAEMEARTFHRRTLVERLRARRDGGRPTPVQGDDESTDPGSG